ncbi:MAG TPA: SDR family NAD(P)-dependent oxidoreductase [Acidimicrobiales bacterium]
MNAFDLTGRVALVTGAASGIGRASAERMAEAGATVVCADRDAEGATITARQITGAGGQADSVSLDVTDAEEVEAVVQGAVERHGRLDVMANVAGIIHTSTVLETQESDLDRLLAVNLKGVFFGCQSAGRVMVAQGSGSIVNMASAAIDQPAPRLAPYGMAKAALVQLTKVLATEIGPIGVRVNAVAPGYIVTGMTNRAWVAEDGTEDEEAKAAVTAQMAKGAPLRTVGEPDDIAYAVLYLASDASKFMTGQILRPNGGVAMPW